jgi:hypothetical protein
MLSETARLAVIDIRDCIPLAREFTDGLTSPTFAASGSPFRRDASARDRLRSEHTLDDELRDRHLESQWRAMRAGAPSCFGISALVWL